MTSDPFDGGGEMEAEDDFGLPGVPQGRRARGPRTVRIAIVLALVVLLAGGFALVRRRNHDPAAGVPDLVVFLQPGMSAEAQNVVLNRLKANSDIDHVDFVDQVASLAEFKCMVPDKGAAVSTDVLPPSYRVTLHDNARTRTDAIGTELSTINGVREVVRARLQAQSATTARGAYDVGGARFGPHDRCVDPRAAKRVL